MHCSQAWLSVAKKAPLSSILWLERTPCPRMQLMLGASLAPQPKHRVYIAQFLQVCELFKLLSAFSTEFCDHVYSFGLFLHKL